MDAAKENKSSSPGKINLSIWITRAFAVIGVLFVIQQLFLFLLRNHEGFSGLQSYFTSSHDSWPENALSHQKIAPNTTSESKALVVASLVEEETQWVLDHFSTDWETNVFVVNDQNAEFTVLRQGGHEAAVYLTYIIQHYYALPEIIVFVHGKRYQWHNDDPLYDSVSPIKNLRLEHVRRVGYQNLRCHWEPGCQDQGLYPRPKAPDGLFGWEALMYNKFRDFFQETQPVPVHIRTTCCAQFAVTRDTIQRHPVEMYEKMRLWLWRSKETKDKTGRVFEYYWHVIFGLEEQACPKARDCYCQVYGMCNLTCQGDKSCDGAFYLAPWTSGNPGPDWPEISGEDGWPKADWFMEFEPWKSGGSPFDDPNGYLEAGAPFENIKFSDEVPNP